MIRQRPEIRYRRILTAVEYVRALQTPEGK
jgi:hypothetical protein